MNEKRPSPWLTVGWILAVLATTVNGLLVGYVSVWFQLFGESADAGDYRVSAGGYGAASVVLLFAVVGILTHRAAPRWLALASAVLAAILSLLSANSLLAASGAEEDGFLVGTTWDGIGGVLWAPWTWVLVGVAIHGLYRLARPHRADERTAVRS